MQGHTEEVDKAGERERLKFLTSHSSSWIGGAIQWVKEHGAYKLEVNIKSSIHLEIYSLASHFIKHR